MKKIIFSLLLIISFIFVACNEAEEPTLKDCKITFVNALDEVMKEYTVKEGESVVYPSSNEMEMDGYRFLETFDKEITIASKDEIIKGNYIKTWTVNFYNESNQLISSQIIDEGSDAISPDVTSKDGYVFKGWKTEFTNVKNDIDVYGDFEAVTCNFQYSSNLEDSILCNVENDSHVPYNKTVTIKAKEISGYCFIGFYENDELISSDAQYSFKITTDCTITAKYVAVELEFFVEDGATFVYFGSYPQTLLEDDSIIAALDKQEPDEKGYITYNGISYCKLTATTLTQTTYKSVSGNKEIKNGEVYYFIVEPIKWRVIYTGPNSYELFSEYTIDVGVFYGGENGELGTREIDGKTIYANNYKYSDVREYLNNDFYNTAFSDTEKQIIRTTFVDNSAKTGLDFNSDMDPTAYACEDTYDKVYLLSYKEYESKPINKKARVTDYAIAKGCWIPQFDPNKYYTYWWFRTPNPKYFDVTWFDSCALNADEEGGFDWNLFVVYDYVGYRPAITTAK